MKKILMVLMALALAMTCFAAFAEEEPIIQEAPNPDPFSGIWECDRATAEIVWEEEGYKVLIHWGSSAEEATEWEYSCYYNEENKTMLSMPFGMRTELTFDENGNEASYNVVYEDGTAEFSLDEDGHLIWKDEKEDAGKDMAFEWVSRYPDPFSGVWECDRATIEIVDEGEGYKVFIHWGSSAWETTTWDYACYYKAENNTLLSTPFGIRTELVFDDNGEETATTVYDDGVAEFSLDADGHLIWKDEKEDAGKDMAFEWVSAYGIDAETEEADG